MDQQKFEQALALASPYGANLTEDTTPALVVQYVPTLGDNAVGCKLAIVTATGFTFTYDYGAGYTTPSTNDQTGLEASGTLTFATYTTLGALVDAINGTKSLRAYLVGGIRATTSASRLLAIAATACSGDNGLTVYFDGSSKTVGAAISGEKFVNNGKNGWVKEGINFEAALNQLIYATITATYTTISTSSIQVYFSTQAADQQIYSVAVAATTVAKTLQAASADLVQLFASAPPGSRIVVQAVFAAGTTLTTVDRFDILGKTAILSGKRLVTEKNF